MIRETLSKIMQEFPTARTERFNAHPLAEYVRHEIPRNFRGLSDTHRNHKWDASAGKGKWVEGPWIAAFNTIITVTAQRGYYPVYLFTQSCDAVFLSMNQGVTDLQEEYGKKEAKQLLLLRGKVLRERLAEEYGPLFSPTPIKLQSRRKNSLLEFYEAGHAFGVRYDRDNLPTEVILERDLSRMLALYNLALIRGGVDALENEPGNTLEERRRYKLHRTIERNPNLAKKAKEIHGYRCQVCEFDFSQMYGELGEGYIEAHHLIPLSKLPENEPVKLDPRKDFAVVCANCHRMIHRSGSPETFQDFSNYYRSLH